MARKKKKRRQRRNTSREETSAKGPVPVLEMPAPSARPRLRGWHKGVVLLGAMAGVPALFFVTVELGLRVAGYGYPTAYFTPWEMDGKLAYVNNLDATDKSPASHISRHCEGA